MDGTNGKGEWLAGMLPSALHKRESKGLDVPLNVTQFSYNLQYSEATGKSPFEIVIGQQPTVPIAILSACTEKDPASCRVAKVWTSRSLMAVARSWGS